MSDDQTSEDHLHSSPQVGGEGPGLHAGRSNLAKIQGSTGSGVRYNPQTGDKLDGSTGPGKKGDQSGSPSDMNRNVTYGDTSTPQNTSHYGNLEDRRNFSSPSTAHRDHTKVGDLGNRLDESRKNPTERGFMGSVQDWGRKVAARSESGPVEKAAENFVSQPQFAAKGEKPPDSAAHATNLEGNARPTAQNIANELRNKAKPGTPSSSETLKSNPSSETPRTSGGAKSHSSGFRTQGTVNLFGDVYHTATGGIKHRGSPEGDYSIQGAYDPTALSSNKNYPVKGGWHVSDYKDPTTGKLRTSVEIHSTRAGSDQLDRMFTEGCFGISRDEWPKFKEGLQQYQKDNPDKKLIWRQGKDGNAEVLAKPQSETPKSNPSVDKEVEQGKKQFEEKKEEPNKEEAPPSEPQAKEPSMTSVKDSGGGDPHTDEKLSVYKNLFL